MLGGGKRKRKEGRTEQEEKKEKRTGRKGKEGPQDWKEGRDRHKTGQAGLGRHGMVRQEHLPMHSLPLLLHAKTLGAMVSLTPQRISDSRRRTDFAVVGRRTPSLGLDIFSAEHTCCFADGRTAWYARFLLPCGTAYRINMRTATYHHLPNMLILKFIFIPPWFNAPSSPSVTTIYRWDTSCRWFLHAYVTLVSWRRFDAFCNFPITRVPARAVALRPRRFAGVARSAMPLPQSTFPSFWRPTARGTGLGILLL